jgi:hypothetical protein
MWENAAIIVMLLLLVWGFWIVLAPASQKQRTSEFSFFAEISNSSAAGQNLEMYDIKGSQPGPFICLVAGTHGNEPAGTLALRQMMQNGEFTVQKGHLRIIPCVNSWGIQNNVRYQSPGGIFSSTGDVNRNYNSEGGTDPISDQVINLVAGADLVIDFHEGWGYHRCQPTSVGSSLSPTDFSPAPELAAQMVDKLNTDIAANPPPGKTAVNPDCKKFMVLGQESCTIQSTLACHMQKNNRAYILVETTGQEDIQPPEVRMSQVKSVVQTALQYMNS